MPVPTASFSARHHQFVQDSRTAWCRLARLLAGDHDRVVWRGLETIADVLRLLGERAPLNHTFMPGGGGLDLVGASLSAERGCIALRFDLGTTIVRPATLELVTFADDPLADWAYFRLECGELEPSGTYDEVSGDREYLVRLDDGEYVDRSCWDRGFLEYDEDEREVPLPPGAEPITRQLRGAFVTFAKGSTYNAIPGPYDGRHNKMSADEFRAYIAQGLAEVRARGIYGAQRP